MPESLYEQAIQRYNTIGEYLGQEGSALEKFNPKIYSQGSFRLGTVIKPLKTDEFDIDLVCQLELDKEIGQNSLYNMVGERLRENKIYEKLLQSKKRCWRLKYANEFHMDILPAIPDQSIMDNSILVPDKKLGAWVPSNPKDYVDWFYKQMKSIRESLIIEARAEIEKVPFYKFKTPLQRAIQILKRQRDIVFENDNEDKPISIIITTLASKAYNNEASLYEALKNIIEGMPNEFDMVEGDIGVLNPVNLKENFADKWKKHPERKTKFIEWLKTLSKNLNKIILIDNEENYFTEMGLLFGSDYVAKIFDSQKEQLMRRFKRKPIIISNPPKPWQK